MTRRDTEKRDAAANTLELWLVVESMGEKGDRESGVRELPAPQPRVARSLP